MGERIVAGDAHGLVVVALVVVVEPLAFLRSLVKALTILMLRKVSSSVVYMTAISSIARRLARLSICASQRTEMAATGATTSVSNSNRQQNQSPP